MPFIIKLLPVSSHVSTKYKVKRFISVCFFHFSVFALAAYIIISTSQSIWYTKVKLGPLNGLKIFHSYKKYFLFLFL